MNPYSQERHYEIGGYEQYAFIDPNRSLSTALPKGGNSPQQKLPVKAVESTVLFETVALGAKLQNTHKMGGERVKEMDHFVASIETPRVNVKLPDVAPLVTEMCKEGCRGQGCFDESVVLQARAHFRDDDAVRSISAQ